MAPTCSGASRTLLGRASPNGAAGEGPGRTNGKLHIPVQQTYKLAQAPEALATLTGEHTQGKSQSE